MARGGRVPLMVILIGIGAAAMYLPAAHAIVVGDWLAARSFFYAGTVFAFLALITGIATRGSKGRNEARNHLLALPAGFALLPLMLAVPFDAAVPDTSYFNAYFEMVSSLTTTGATLFDDPARLPDSVHLWRALVGWLGGFFVWLTAMAVLAPMNLGGFEVISSGLAGAGARERGEAVSAADPRGLMVRYSGQLAPIYAGLTGALWLLLILVGERPLVGLCHAMSVLSSSGISPVGGLQGSAAGIPGEAVMFVFMGFALSRRTFAPEAWRGNWSRLTGDPEFTLGLALVAAVPALLFVRHWLGAYDVDEQQNLGAALRALWGSVFSVASFLTTTGFASVEWSGARVWSGLQTPGMVLLGLAIFGGGVATTAGGVKLLRVYALYKHGVRELERLVHPSSVGGAGPLARQIRRQGAHVAWIFFMLFALSIALVMSALSLTGLHFEDVTILSVAALSTTGPLAGVAGEVPISFAELDAAGKAIIAAAMVLGRLETLAIIALLNPEFWRS